MQASYRSVEHALFFGAPSPVEQQAFASAISGDTEHAEELLSQAIVDQPERLDYINSYLQPGYRRSVLYQKFTLPENTAVMENLSSTAPVDTLRKAEKVSLVPPTYEPTSHENIPFLAEPIKKTVSFGEDDSINPRASETADGLRRRQNTASFKQ